MNNRSFLFWVMFIALGFIFSRSATAEIPEHEFIGASKCAMCHKKADVGRQHEIWMQSKHAMAMESLATPQAKEIASKMGIHDPQTDGRCLKCHSAAYGFSENRVSDKIAVEEGVSCESCHGPGKDYMKKSVMQIREEAVAAGLILPDEKICLKCHNEESPTYKGFDFHDRWEEIKHPIPD